MLTKTKNQKMKKKMANQIWKIKHPILLKVKLLMIRKRKVAHTGLQKVHVH